MPTKEEIEQFLVLHGCFCGGSGEYTDYNCGEAFEMMCPHCCGTGKKLCECTDVSLRCDRGSSKRQG